MKYIANENGDVNMIDRAVKTGLSTEAMAHKVFVLHNSTGDRVACWKFGGGWATRPAGAFSQSHIRSAFRPFLNTQSVPDQQKPDDDAKDGAGPLKPLIVALF